ncbi:DNA repair and recombination protein RadB [Candidatus Woesearchaeota archaeon]|nr:DNA repair and recombination protein RadB [Candidatus Woesearchaeota archaeon]
MYKIERISAGSKIFDHMLEGGYETDCITTLYGPAGSGKTNLCILAMVAVARHGKKVIYIDTDGGFSPERLRQIAGEESILDNILFLQPTNFEEQEKAFHKLKDMVDARIGLIVVDSVSMLYRLEMGKKGEITDINKALSLQISYLGEIARKEKIPILLTNQVYADFEDKQRIHMVGGDILKYGSKCLIELQKYRGSIRKAILRKHRSIGEKEVYFEITERGLQEVDIQ